MAGGSGSGKSTLARQVAAAVSPLTVDPAPVIIIDGILLLGDARVRDVCDVTVCVDADADVGLARRLRRDMRYADLILPHATDNAIAVEMTVANIQDCLHAEGALP